ncbi:glycosyltransferase family 4 protein [Vibrio mediterranei]|uniref:glycosyltransferase family 4 protein n=1 Tax=Vibrio mediterranei TaxID=689 RepID=UPI001EFE27B2|nr:glycosyltransferase family 4 protein [Vibrio mediterranei]MCG9666046.1 glycosyltransferase family 4 protein [Vibrio mediterranei]
MRVLIACSSRIDVGSGILAYAKNMTEYYLQNGHDVGFVYLNSQNTEWCDNKKNFRSYAIDLKSETKMETDKLLQFIEEYDPDVVINNDNAYLQSIAPVIPCPFVFVLHLGNYSILSLAKINEKYVDQYIATTSDMKFDLVRVGIPSSKISVVLNGLNNESKFNTEIKENDNKINILFAGEMTKRKGFDKFIKLIESKSFENCIFHWTGGEKALKLKAKLNQHNEVIIYKRLPKDDFYKLFSECDIFLMPSRDEGLPIALLESFFFGLVPIVSNGKGAMKEVVSHGTTGYVCEINNWESEASEILSKLTHDDIYKKKNAVVRSFNSNLANGFYARDILRIASTLNKEKGILKNIPDYYNWHRPNVHNINIFLGIWYRLKVRLGIITKSRKGVK